MLHQNINEFQDNYHQIMYELGRKKVKIEALYMNEMLIYFVYRGNEFN